MSSAADTPPPPGAPANLEEWTGEQVCAWFLSPGMAPVLGPGAAEYAARADHEEIDGLALADMTKEQLTQDLEMKAGPAVRLRRTITAMLAGDARPPVPGSVPPAPKSMQIPPLPTEAELAQLREELDALMRRDAGAAQESEELRDLFALETRARDMQAILDRHPPEARATRALRERLAPLVRDVATLVKVRTGKKAEIGTPINPHTIGYLGLIGLDDEGAPKGKQGSQLWRAVLNGVNYPVCVKRMNLEGTPLSDVRNFENEVQLMSQVHHTNICTFLGACIESDSAILLVTTLCRSDLSAYMKSEEFKQTTLLDKLELGKGICQGMAWLHGLQLVHCDLKPDNVLVDDHNVPKITDFGYSRILPSSAIAARNDQASLSQGGSPLYMSPERLLMLPDVDMKAADVYSFGIIFWEIVTPQPNQPFEKYVTMSDYDEALHAYTYGVCTELDRPPLARETPDAVRVLLDRAWHPTPTTRPSFSELVDMIDDVTLAVTVPDPEARMLWRAHFVSRHEIHGNTHAGGVPVPGGGDPIRGGPSAAAGGSGGQLLGSRPVPTPMGLARVVTTVEYEVPWERFKPVFGGAIGLPMEVVFADWVTEPSSEDLGDNPTDAELERAEEDVLDRYAKSSPLAATLPRTDPRHPAQRMQREKLRRELIIKLDAARELLCDPSRSNCVTLERFGKITAMFGPLVHPAAVYELDADSDDMAMDGGGAGAAGGGGGGGGGGHYQRIAAVDDETMVRRHVRGRLKQRRLAQSMLDKIFELMNLPWFRRDLNQQQAWEVLRYRRRGDFILRFSTRQQALVLSVVSQGQNKKREVVHVLVTHTTAQNKNHLTVAALARSPMHDGGGEQKEGFSMGTTGPVVRTLQDLVAENRRFLRVPITQAGTQQGSWLSSVNTHRRIYMEDTPLFYQPSLGISPGAAMAAAEAAAAGGGGSGSGAAR